MSKVTIAIPTYNRKDYLSETIASILNQTFQDFEILIFDNHSDYDVKIFLAEFKDPRISLVASEVNLGNLGNFQRIYGYNFNSKYLMVFHDDDVMHPQLLEREVAVMETKKGLVWVGTGLTFVKNGQPMNKFEKFKTGANPVFCSQTELVMLILRNFNLAFNTVLYRTNFIELINTFSSKFKKWWDRPYLVNLAGKGQVAVIKEPLVNYRVHQAQDSQKSSDLELQMNAGKELLSYYREQLPKPLSKEDKALFWRFASNNVLGMAAGQASSYNGFRAIIENFRQQGMFSWRYVGIRGLYYAFKSLIKK